MRNNPRALATHSNVPRKKGLRCTSLWLLASITRTSERLLQDLPSAHARSGALPFNPGLKLVDEAHWCLAKLGLRCGDPGDDGYTRKKGWGRLRRTVESGGLGASSFTFVFPAPIIHFTPPPRCVVRAVVERPFLNPKTSYVH